MIETMPPNHSPEQPAVGACIPLSRFAIGENGQAIERGSTEVSRQAQERHISLLGGLCPQASRWSWSHRSRTFPGASADWKPLFRCRG
jgi:hypothetical protein